MLSWLEREIHSQPALIADLLERALPQVQDIAARLPSFTYALIAARGSSDHAATYAKYVWESLAGCPVALAEPAIVTLWELTPRRD
jgi:glucosamine--fructose-6-phosphate aminotransferase (isomerizing)